MSNYDPDLLDMLEAEYMADIMAGQIKALDYALENSDRFNTAVAVALLKIFTLDEAQQPAANILKGMQTFLLTVLAQDAAPRWAEWEYPRRAREHEEMLEEYRLSRGPMDNCAQAAEGI